MTEITKGGSAVQEPKGRGYVTVQQPVNRLIVLVPAQNRGEETNPYYETPMLASGQLSKREHIEYIKDLKGVTSVFVRLTYSIRNTTVKFSKIVQTIVRSSYKVYIIIICQVIVIQVN